MELLRIAHISDLHVLDLTGTGWHRYLNKRVTGAMNLAGIRRNAHPTAVAELLADRLAAGDIDHVIVTGDLTNLALESEFERARQVIARIGPPSRVTLIPGNHDLYTRGALRHRRFEKWFGAYLVDDDTAHLRPGERGRLHYPFVRKPAPHVRIYGLSSAIPTPPLLAYGHVGRPQLERLAALVADEPAEVQVRLVLVHHNLHHRMGVAEYTASLWDRKAFSQAMHGIRASAVLHGHTHHPHQGHLPAKVAHSPAQAARDDAFDRQLEDALAAAVGDIPVIGCGSSTWHRKGKELARFNVLEVSDKRLERVRSYRYTSTSGLFEDEHLDLLDRALHRSQAIVV
jgi:3',5'-cyclic AMP phosphodiesterase CpdA